MGEAYADYR